MANKRSSPRTAAADRARSLDSTQVALLCVATWALPGAGHLWLGRKQKAWVFLVALPLMFVIGLLLQGRLFPFVPTEPLVALAALADLGVGAPYIVTRLLGYGGGDVVAAAYEYGNTFLIAAGLLNFLVILDTFDIALGRK